MDYYYKFNGCIYSVFLANMWFRGVIEQGLTVDIHLNELVNEEDNIKKIYKSRMYRDQNGNAVISFKNQTVNAKTDWIWWPLEELLENQRKGMYVNNDKLIQSIYKRGLDKIIVHVPDRDENDVDIPCHFVENEYKLLEGYKLEVKSIAPYLTHMGKILAGIFFKSEVDTFYYERSFYQSDFCYNVERGYINLELL